MAEGAVAGLDLGTAVRALVRGIERADSLAVDAHKWLNVRNGDGFVLFRDAELHRETFSGSAGYLSPGGRPRTASARLRTGSQRRGPG